MIKNVEKFTNNNVSYKAIHYGTFIAIMLLVIPVAINSKYLILIFMLAGVNLFNSVFRQYKDNKIHVFFIALFSLLPVLIYITLIYLVQ